jgi:hypothetical protein
MTKKLLCGAGLVALVAGLTACGGGGSSPTSSSVPAATPAPSAAAIAAEGAGRLVLHPSRYSTWAYALETPVRIRETGGGRAKWNYARLSLVRAGREIERSEVGSDYLASPPDWTNIAANSNAAYSLVFRLNSSNFDRVDITLGFTDVNTGRQFVTEVPFGSFSGVDVSLVVLNVPDPGVTRLE